MPGGHIQEILQHRDKLLEEIKRYNRIKKQRTHQTTYTYINKAERTQRIRTGIHKSTHTHITGYINL